MPDLRYIKVILPLRLEWEPLYSYESGSGALNVGDRVRVNFASKEYVATVSDADASSLAQKVGASKIKPIIAPAEDLEKISCEEIELWRQVASYYLCSIGEVYKAAYPALKVAEEETRARVEASKKAREEAKAEERSRVEAARKARKEARIDKLEEMILKARKAEAKERYIKEREVLLAELEATKSLSEEPSETSDVALNGADSARIQLSEAQAKTAEEIKALWKAQKPALLQGVTGSGKTEIYLKLAQEVLEEGRNVLFLVPEIALSRQLEERIGSIFPDELQVFHSGETALHRHQAAAFIRNNPYIALGTRSAIFLPHKNLGLVIVDEEHDSSYKQDSPAPRYNGRETAIMLARIFGANVVLGSATPSLESLYNCSVGRYGLSILTKRFYDAADSDVEVIDTIAERKKNGMVGSFSRKLIDHINSCLERHEQVVILRERRAYAPIVQCESCGEIPRCKKCNVTLALHKRGGSDKLVCHYCGRVQEFTGTCPKCGGKMIPLGSGTQKIEEEAKTLFPQARIARLDGDSAQNRKHESEVIKQFANGETDILIGTQIVSKGFDFSGLTLVAVLQADSILGQDDYKADERGLHLLEQFRGRCGRRGEKGLFVIQTSQPAHPVYQTIEGGMQSDQMLGRFLQERRAFGYPPYSRIVGIIIKDYNLPRLEALARDLSWALMNCGLSASAKVIGPFAPAVDKVSGQHIRKIRVLLPKDKSLLANKSLLQATTSKFEKERKYLGHIALDVDPA